MTERPEPTPSPKHELRDVNARATAWTGVGLYAAMLLVFLIVWAAFHLFAHRQSQSAPPPSPWFGLHPQPPEPRLTATPARDLAAFRAMEDQRLNHYAWVDRQAGVVRIPIERAMQRMAERNRASATETNVPQPEAGEKQP